MSLTEFEIIDQYFRKHVVKHPYVVSEIGDDAAILKMPEDKELVISADTLVANVHFPDSIRPCDLGYRALAVNLSDMAAMGADPQWITLALTLPDADENWLTDFSEGLFQLCNEYQIALIGGDITHGPLSITIQIHGFTDKDMAILRTGARPGDLVCVTGELGAAGIALACMNQEIALTPAVEAQASTRYFRPLPRVKAGLALQGLASSAIDISDGLLSDLGHILQASRVGASIKIEHLPVFNPGGGIEDKVATHHALCSGDDYELCFTVPPARREAMEKRMKDICPVSCIGEIDTSKVLKCIARDGQLINPDGTGYQHFS